MKKTILFAVALACGISSRAADVKLIVQKIDNGQAVAGQTYRVYAKLPAADYSLQVVYGDSQHPLSIKSAAPFFQSPIAGHSAAGISTVAEQADASVRFDSWITLGYANNESNSMWDVGVDFATFDSGGEIRTENGGWFLVPTDAMCQPNSQGLVLIGQFTSTGVIKGMMNLQGKTPTGEIWQEKGVGFITSNAEVFGCTDRASANYNPQATFNDGSCNGQCIPKPEATAAQGAWEVFPNPLRSNVLSIQLNELEVTPGARLEILDMNGKTVASHTIGKDTMISGNRLSIDQSLAAGTYQVAILQNNSREVKTLVVQ
ncbi:MAG: T9SS type A sorting domain-containing protein [Flavobacteriales bacterium]|jgi:hypothetical protein